MSTPRCRRHDMRPSVLLPSVSGIDSKLGLTMVKPNLQSAPEPSALDLPPVCKHVRQICGNFLGFWRPVTLTFNLFNWKLAPYTRALGNVYANIDFCTFLFLRYEPVRDRRVMRPTRRPFNSAFITLLLKTQTTRCLLKDALFRYYFYNH